MSGFAMQFSLPGAIILAAGLSRRMGTPKMVLPWGNSTVIEQVIQGLHKAGINEIIVVTGSNQDIIEPLLHPLNVHVVFNPDFANGEMLNSLQIGLGNASSSIPAIFMVLGDQPTLDIYVLMGLMEEFSRSGAGIIIPSYQMHRGHPWLVARPFWTQILNLKPPQTLRDFLRANETAIKYVESDSDSVLQDLDTPQDYDKFRPKGS